MAELYQKYVTEIRPALQKDMEFSSVMQVPRLEKVTLNMGVGEAVADRKVLENAVADLRLIAGQQPVVCLARKSEAVFKIRAGWPIGCKVTLRSERMYEFIERLIGIAIPRIRDFRGLNPKSFDGRGNFSMGLTEQIVFPEIDYDKIDKIRGLDIAITTSARSDEEGLALLRSFNFPFISTNNCNAQSPFNLREATTILIDTQSRPTNTLNFFNYRLTFMVTKYNC